MTQHSFPDTRFAVKIARRQLHLAASTEAILRQHRRDEIIWTIVASLVASVVTVSAVALSVWGS